MQSEISRRRQRVPPIVHVVLTQATRRRAQGGMSEALFEEHIRRLAHEELEPEGLKLLACRLSGGRTRFIIKEQATGTDCGRLHFDAQGMLEPDSA
jgi:hypothetical protein